MELTVNKSILSSLLNDEAEYSEIIAFLNEIIDDEIEKDNPDCDLIDDCVNAIEALEAERNPQPFVRLVLTEKQVVHYCKRHSRSSSAVKSVIAAGIVLVLGTAVMLNTTPAIAENVKALFEVIASALLDVSSDTEVGYDDLSSIYASLSEDSNLIVNDIDDIDVSKISVTAVYNDASERKIDISDCTVRKDLKQTANGEFIVVTISYNGCACSMAFEIKG